MKNKKNKILFASNEALEHAHLSQGLAQSPFGPCLLVMHQDALVFLGFCLNRGVADEIIRELKNLWRPELITLDAARVNVVAQGIFGDGEPPDVCLVGSEFQHRVWQLLLEIVPGETKTYGDIAKAMGSAPRAVGRAIARNPISYIVPCHRVLAQGSKLHNYRWGKAIKEKILAREGACFAA